MIIVNVSLFIFLCKAEFGEKQDKKRTSKWRIKSISLNYMEIKVVVMCNKKINKFRLFIFVFFNDFMFNKYNLYYGKRAKRILDW